MYDDPAYFDGLRENILAYKRLCVSDELESFMSSTTPGANVIKLFTAVSYKFS